MKSLSFSCACSRARCISKARKGGGASVSTAVVAALPAGAPRGGWLGASMRSGNTAKTKTATAPSSASAPPNHHARAPSPGKASARLGRSPLRCDSGAATGSMTS